MADARYIIHATRSQLQTIRAACELYARIGIGQFASAVEYPISLSITDVDAIGRIREYLDGAEREFRSAKSADTGIGGDNVPQPCKTAYDIHQVFRHLLAWQRNPEGGWAVDFDNPTQYGEEPLIEVDPAEGVPDRRPKSAAEEMCRWKQF